MTIKIRHGVYETNSSSTHSVSINTDSIVLDTILPDADGIITVRGGEYGWEWEKSNDAYWKACYALTGTMYLGSSQQKGEDNIKAVIQDHTLATEVILTKLTDRWNDEDDTDAFYAYIDHQSVGEISHILLDRELLRNFIFNKNTWMFLGNDNSSAPNKFYDTQPLEYKWKLVFPDYPRVPAWEFVNKPNREEILEAVNSMELRFKQVGNKKVAEVRSSHWSSSERYYEVGSDSLITDTGITFSYRSWSNKGESEDYTVRYEIREIE